jgi:hypothetical protein
MTRLWKKAEVGDDFAALEDGENKGYQKISRTNEHSWFCRMKKDRP